jgi:hypothetical protein
MSCDRLPVGAPDALLRWSTHRRLDHETRQLEKAGCAVVRIEPGASSRRAMGFNPMRENRLEEVVASAIDETERWVADGRIPRITATTGSRPITV